MSLFAQDFLRRSVKHQASLIYSLPRPPVGSRHVFQQGRLRWFREAAEQGFTEATAGIKAAEDALTATAAAKPSPSSRTCCANCAISETAGSSVSLKPCSRCKAVVYCGRECQAAHWKAGGHRAVCKGI